MAGEQVGVSEQFGPYRLEKLLGRGGMGEVFRAFDTEHGRLVAVKRLNAHLADDPEYRTRFRREATIAAQLRNPHIVPIHRFGELNGHLFIDMRYVEGFDVAGLVSDVGALAPARAVAIVEQAASALQTAHKAGLVHRDVKPSNLLVDREGGDETVDFVYLADFGISRPTSVEQSQALTQTGALLGSLDYMAPEQFDGVANRQADVYALACVLFELLTGAKPFRGDGLAAMMLAHLTMPPPSATGMRPGVPVGFDEVIRHGLAKQPDERFSSTVDLARAARAALNGPTVPYPRRPAPEVHAGVSTNAMPMPLSAPVPGPMPMPGPTPMQAPPPGEAQRVSLPPRPQNFGTMPAPLYGPGHTARVQDRPPTDPGAARPPERKRRRGLVWAIVGGLVAVAVVIAAVLVIVPLTRTPALTLEAAGTAGADAFTTDFRTGRAAVGSASTLPAGIADRSAVPGSTEGIYAGAKGEGTCDRAGLAAYLTGHPSAAAAWASAVSADPNARVPGSRAPVVAANLPTYIYALTPVLLRADTRLDDHVLDGDKPGTQRAVLQAGTAVLVDSLGLPRVRCISGSPLTFPTQVDPKGSVGGDTWTGYDAAAVVTMVAARNEIHQFGLSGATGASAFRRPAATTGTADLDQVPATAAIEGVFALKTTTHSCENLNNCEKSPTYAPTVRIHDCTTQQCAISSEQEYWTGDLVLKKDGATWTAQGPSPEKYGQNCHGVPKPTTVKLQLTAADPFVDENGGWTARSLTGSEIDSSGATDTCSTASETWGLAGGQA